MATAPEIRFCIAGLEVLLRSHQSEGLASLAGFYRQYPSRGGEPGLIVEFDGKPGFARGRQRGPEYPAFRCDLLGPGRIGLSRFDAEGEIALPASTGSGGPVYGRFRGNGSANTLEAAVRIGTSIALPRLGGLVLHSSAIAHRGEVLVFAGVSGAGKSTIARLLADSDVNSITKISDELVIVKRGSGGRWAAYVTPFIGSDGLPHGTSLPVAAVHFLEQAPHHRRERKSHGDAMRELLKHVLVYVAESDTAARVLATAGQLTGEVPCYRLQFAKNPGILEVLGIT